MSTSHDAGIETPAEVLKRVATVVRVCRSLGPDFEDVARQAHEPQPPDGDAQSREALRRRLEELLELVPEELRERIRADGEAVIEALTGGTDG